MADKKGDYKVGEEMKEKEDERKKKIKEAGQKSEPIVATHWTLQTAAGAALKEDKKKKDKKKKTMDVTKIHVGKDDKKKEAKADK